MKYERKITLHEDQENIEHGTSDIERRRKWADLEFRVILNIRFIHVDDVIAIVVIIKIIRQLLRQ